ncbi:hypothetical protein D3C85_1440180 [compost metagenome]
MMTTWRWPLMASTSRAAREPASVSTIMTTPPVRGVASSRKPMTRPTSTRGTNSSRKRITASWPPTWWMSAACGVRLSTMADRGATRVCSAADTTIPSSTARVSGRLRVKVEPLPGTELIEIRPPRA